jgi:hypothetical protein
MNRRRMLRYGLLGVGTVVALVGSWLAVELGADFFHLVLPWHRQSALDATRAWAGLAPFPDAATDLTVSTDGTMFTRTFDVTFKASAPDIGEWIERSPRLRNNLPTSVDADCDRYDIHPGEEGAFGGTVEINRREHRVRIHVSWS